MLSDKGTNVSKITLLRTEKVISDDQQLFKIFCNFFQYVLNTLAIKGDVEKSDFFKSNDLVETAIRIYNGHTRIKKT